jgi:hypothetical protein
MNTDSVADLLGSLIDGHFIAHESGYEPDDAKLSPGDVLWFKIESED